MVLVEKLRCTGGAHSNQTDHPETKKTKEVEQPWRTILPLVHVFKGADIASWWNRTGSFLGTMMEEAGYDLQTQYSCLIFHLYHIVPRLGPVTRYLASSDHWRSFMNDDFSPIEYSWNWDTPKNGPKVRYSVELIGANAGTSIDPYNQHSSIELCEQLQRDLPGTDLTLFNIMKDAFYDANIAPKNNTTKDSDRASPSSIFLAVELGKTIATKAYFIPVKAEQHNTSRLSVLNSTIATLRHHGYPCTTYDQLLHFISTTPQGSTLNVVCVAIDLNPSTSSRFKIYLRSPSTSFASVCEMMTFGSTLPPLSDVARANLKALWHSSLGLPSDFPEDEELQPKVKGHETSGILYYFDINLYGSGGTAKLYIPLKHYAKNDAVAAKGLGEYLESRGQDKLYSRYMSVLERTCTHRGLEEGSGYQTYLGTSVQKDGSLALCSYVNGEAFHLRRMGE